MSSYERDLFNLIDDVKNQVRAMPLYLGGVASADGGGGGPPGGFVGRLPQNRVTYDLSELATDATASGYSLLDNLNHIRYRLGIVESGTAATSGFSNAVTFEDNVTIEGTTTFKGVVTFEDTGTYWLDEKGQLSSAKIASPSSKVVQDSAESAYYFKDDATPSDYLWVNIQLNHDRKLTSKIYPHLHWWQTSATIPNWLVSYRWQIQGQVKTTDWSSVPWTTHAFEWTTGTLNQITSFTAITPPSGSGLSDILQIRIIRDTANASGLLAGSDGLAGNVYVNDFDIHKEIDTLGSNTEYSKV